MVEFGLIADVGGTNIRLALVDLNTGNISHIKKYLCADYPEITDVIQLYLAPVEQNVSDACIAIACPTDEDLIQMTNHAWSFSKSEVKELLGFERFDVINDYTAISLSIPALKEEQKIKIGGGQAEQGKPIAVYGPGTGLGVAHLINHCDTWISLPGEGGHVSFAPQNLQETHVLTHLQAKYGHVSVERILSGPGLVNLYQAIAQYQGVSPQPYEAPDITANALEKKCTICQETLSQFCRIMGSFGGNLALTMSTYGGVYIAGGIIPRFIEYFSKSEFRTQFEAKGRFNHLIQRVPVYVITEEQPGLLGASVHLRQETGHKV